MLKLENLTNEELAFLLLFKMWWMFDAGGISNDRGARATVVEAFTRGTLLPSPKPFDEWRQHCHDDCIKEALRRAPDASITANCDFTRRLNRFRNREFIAVLLRWLGDYYERAMQKPLLEQPSGENYWFRPLVHLIPLPADTPLLGIEELYYERRRRDHRRFNRRLFRREEQFEEGSL
jgi:hypothetical protein